MLSESAEDEAAKELRSSIQIMDKEFKKSLDTYVKHLAVRDALQEASTFAEDNLFEGDVVVENLEANKTRRLNDVFKEAHEKVVREEMNRTQKNRYAKARLEREYEIFRKEIHEAGHDADEPMPDITRYYDDGDDELVVEQEKVSYKCPLTKDWLSDPVTSKKCNHSFSNEAIMALIRASAVSTILCPVPACGSHFSSRDLVRNPQLAAAAQLRAAKEAKETQNLNRDLEKL
jgi:SUMO ligase MMS21 Smc5/6 complex component